MKRYIVKFNPLVSLEANSISNFSMFSLPDRSILLQHEGNLYLDYLDEGQFPVPTDPYYVGEMQADGSVVDLVGDASQFPHCFSGWDRKVPDALIMANAAITPRQARLALLQTGLLSSVELIISQQSEAIRLTWEYSTQVQRNNPLINQILTALGKTGKDIDDLFLLGATL